MKTKTIQIGLALLALFCLALPSKAQQLIGSTGLMNIPTADMQPEATFVGGASIFQQEASNGGFNYDTGLYFVSFTPFKFIEGTFRFSLLKTKHNVNGKTGYYRQDRSSTLRIRPLSEGKWWPSVVIGMNDPFTTGGDSPYMSYFGAATKHLSLGRAGQIGLTAGYAKPFKSGVMYDGVFGGIDYSPLKSNNLHLTAEYDTHGFNLGVYGQLWKALNLFVYTHEFKGLAAGISYQHTIKF